MKHNLLICILLAGLLSACTEGGIFHKEKRYTPLYLYSNPLDPDITNLFVNNGYEPEYSYPNFLNYPNDWAKHGLRGNVALVTYSWVNIPNVELGFNKQGNLIYTGSYLGSAKKPESREHAEIREFRYDDFGRLEGVYRNPHNNKWASSDQEFEYDASGKLIKRKGGINYAYQTFSYYDDGTLKEITPKILSDMYLNNGTFGKMEFNGSGELIRTEAPNTTNPFFGEGKMAYRKLRVICTFSYLNGLCSKKQEKIYLKKDTIPTCNSTESYQYNNKGDLIGWEYTGVVCNQTPNEYVFENASFKFQFEYDYDKHDNWTTMRIILPDNFTDSQYLHQYFYIKTGQKLPLPGEKPIINIRRELTYHALPASDSKAVSSTKSDKKPGTPEFTAVQGHGLYGKVKSVSDGDYTISFDEYGNIVSEVWEKSEGRNDYTYDSPTRYLIGTVIGPFRITCKGNIRKEVDENGIEPPVEYQFDAQGRVTYYQYAAGMMPVIEKYTYKGDNKCPDVMVKEESDEEGVYISTSKYTYLKYDKKGNWTKRKVNRTLKNTDYYPEGEKETEATTTKVEPEFTETRTISYY